MTETTAAAPPPQPQALQPGLPLRHALIALAVVAIWGTNFVVIKVGLAHLPPLLFAALRFSFAVFPAIFFLKRPPVSWRMLAAFGLLIGAGQFGLLYIAMGHDISPGLASLVVQSQVFFTIGMAAAIDRERVRGYQIAGLILAVAGIALIAARSGGSVTALGLMLVLGSALSWSGGNLITKAAGRVNMVAFMVWASLFSAPPLYAASLLFEGWPRIAAGLASSNPATWAAVLWQTVANTLFGYSIWGWLLARYPAATVSPMALLVPVFGMASSALLLAEPLPAWKLAAAALVLGGLAVNMLWPRVRSYLLPTGEGKAAHPSGGRLCGPGPK
jgi:O-acetylserine/cysteine efflux transporter